MPERTQVTQVCQLGVEVTKGTAVATTKRLPSFAVVTGIDGDSIKIEQAGYKFPTGYAPGKDFSTAKFSGIPSHDELTYILSSLFSYSIGVQQGATTAYLWTHALSTSSEDTIKSYTVENGSAVRAHKFPYGIFTELSIKGDRSKIEASATMLGQLTTDGITLTAGNTDVLQVPLLPKEVDVFVDTTAAGLGGTKLSRLLKWEFNLKNRFGPLWTVDSAATSWATHVELPIEAEIKLMVEADAQGMGFLTSFRAGDTKFIRIKDTSTVLAGTAFPYATTIEMAGELTGPPKEFSNADGVYAIEWTFGAIHDPTWAKAIQMLVMNKLAAL